MVGELTLELAGEELRLLSAKAMFWPRMEALLVADVHLGKAAAFRAAGMGVPEGASGDLQRLSDLARDTRARKLIVLGDLFHAPEGQTTTIRSALSEWREQHSDLGMQLVRGNHDRECDQLLADCGIESVARAELGGLTLIHDPADLSGQDSYALCGHLHPGVRLKDGLGSFRLPCFWVGARFTALPAFGSFTGTHAIDRCSGDRVFAVAEDQLVEV